MRKPQEASMKIFLWRCWTVLPTPFLKMEEGGKKTSKNISYTTMPFQLRKTGFGVFQDTHIIWWGYEAEAWSPIQTKNRDFRTRHGTRNAAIAAKPFHHLRTILLFWPISIVLCKEHSNFLSPCLSKHSAGNMLLFLALHSVRGNQHLCSNPSAKIYKTKTNQASLQEGK